jgi:hypothetical protein
MPGMTVKVVPGIFYFLVRKQMAKLRGDKTMQITARTDVRTFGIRMTADMIDRIRHEALRRGTSIKQLVCETLDAELPKRLRVVADEPASQRRSKA